jgi:uncharacterized small protein (TIGR04563 family)
LPTHKKQSLYFPNHMLRDIELEAQRVDRSLSWIVQRCIRTSMSEIRRLPSASPEPSHEATQGAASDE